MRDNSDFKPRAELFRLRRRIAWLLVMTILAHAALVGRLGFAQAAVAQAAVTPTEEDTATRTYRELCAGGTSEGRYEVKATPVGTLNISIVCTSSRTMVASVRSKNESMNFSLVHTAVDDNVISFVTFHTAADEAKTMSSSATDLRLRLDIPSLKQGVLKGTLRLLNRIDPLTINVSRTAGFPNLLAKANDQRAIEGSFAFSNEKLKMVVSIEVIGGAQRINLNTPELGGRALYDGLAANEAGGIVYGTSGVDDGTFGNVGLLHVRGRVIGPDEIEIYYLDTRRGLLGPFRALRRKP